MNEWERLHQQAKRYKEMYPPAQGWNSSAWTIPMLLFRPEQEERFNM